MSRLCCWLIIITYQCFCDEIDMLDNAIDQNFTQIIDGVNDVDESSEITDPTTDATIIEQDENSTLSWLDNSIVEQEPGQESGQEPGQEPAQEPGQESAQEPAQEPGQEPGQETAPSSNMTRQLFSRLYDYYQKSKSSIKLNWSFAGCIHTGIFPKELENAKLFWQILGIKGIFNVDPPLNRLCIKVRI